MRNPKDSFSSHLSGYISDEEFPKAIMMHNLRAKIVLNFHRTEEINVGLEQKCSLTLNRKNEATVDVEELYYEPSNNLVVNDHMNLGEDCF